MTATAKIHDLRSASEAHETVVTGHNVRMEFPGPVIALEDATFGIRKGEFVSLIGPSGCGKSTLLRMVAGLLNPTGGRISVNGTPMVGPRAEIGMMFQKATLLDWKPVLDNVLLPNTLAGRVTNADRERAVDLLHMVGLKGFEFAFPRQLSGGMQQRVALARLLNSGADVLLLDEPFGALDEFTRERLNIELMRIQAQIGATIVFVTHNIQEAVFLADRVFVMTPRPGRIAAEVEVNLPRPRTIEQMKSPEFTETAFNIRDTLGGFI
jgi:NitT/TauT family transport system ATP-binding protein